MRITRTLSQPSLNALLKGIESVRPPSIYGILSITIGGKSIGRAHVAFNTVFVWSLPVYFIYSGCPVSILVTTQ